MHELSIARSLIEILERESAGKRFKVEKVHIKIGALSGVATEALLFAYSIASENTVLQGSKLEIEEVGVRIYCQECKEEFETNESDLFRCPSCGRANGQLTAGQELDIVSMEVTE